MFCHALIHGDADVLIGPSCQAEGARVICLLCVEGMCYKSTVYQFVTVRGGAQMFLFSNWRSGNLARGPFCLFRAASCIWAN